MRCDDQPVRLCTAVFAGKLFMAVWHPSVGDLQLYPGTASAICLIIVTLLAGRSKATKSISRMALILVPGVLIYIPLVKINDAVLSKNAEEEE